MQDSAVFGRISHVNHPLDLVIEEGGKGPVFGNGGEFWLFSDAVSNAGGSLNEK
jgi:hypothetical protein